MNIEKVEKKIIANLPDKNEDVIHTRNLKQVLNHRSVLKNVHGVINFNQKVWLKSYMEMSRELRKKAKNDFEKSISKLMNNLVFGKTIEVVRKYRDIKLARTEKRRNYLLSEPNYHRTKFFTENALTIEIRNNKLFMNKPVYLGLSLSKLSKLVMFDFWYDHIKPKYTEKAKLRFMGTYYSFKFYFVPFTFLFHYHYLLSECKSLLLIQEIPSFFYFIVYIKTDGIYKDIAGDVETRFDTSNYKLDRPLPKTEKKNYWFNQKQLSAKLLKNLLD